MLSSIQNIVRYVIFLTFKLHIHVHYFTALTNRGACVELDLYGLAVCAIMSSGELDAEGLTTLALAGGGGGGGGGSSGSGAGAMAQVCCDSSCIAQEVKFGCILRRAWGLKFNVIMHFLLSSIHHFPTECGQ